MASQVVGPAVPIAPVATSMGTPVKSQTKSAISGSPPSSPTSTPLPLSPTATTTVSLSNTNKPSQITSPSKPYPSTTAPQSPDPTNSNPPTSTATIPSMPSLDKDDDVGANGSHSHANTSSEGVKLGIDQLERQQRELEAKRQTQEASQSRRRTHTSSSSLTIPATGAVRRANPFEMMTPRSAPQTAGDVPSTVHLNEIGRRELDDETLGQASLEDNGKKKLKRPASFGKMLKTPLKQTQKFTRKVTDRFSSDPSGIEPSLPIIGSEPLIQGYLHKFGRHGQWQKRWFQTDGINLYYYKSEKRNKLLATLDLKKVGAIEMDPSDPAGCTFYIDVAGRKYSLCAEAADWAKEWVIQLNVVRDARMNHGGLKLVEPTLEEETNDGTRQRSDSEDYTARVVIEAQRPRTKGLGKDDFSDLEQSLEGNHETPGSAMHLTSVMSPTGSMESSNTSHLEKPVAERWRKRRSPFQNIARRLSRWARRMRMLRCVIKDDVIHLHSQQRVEQYQIQEMDSRSYPQVKKLSNAYVQNASSLTSNYTNTKKDDNKEAPFIDLDLDPTLAQLSQFPIVENKAPQTNNAGGSSVQSSTGTGRASPVEIDDKSNMSGVIA